MKGNALIRKLVHSKRLDLFGAALILWVCIYRSFLGTIYLEGKIEFGVPLNQLWSMIQNGAYPLGVMATIGAVFSMLSTRLIGKQNNAGNAIGVVTTVNSGANDFMFGNASAIITYPLTFLINSFAFANWRKGEKIRPRDKYYYIIFIVSLLIGFALVYFGAYLFGGIQSHTFLILVSITFGLSLGANFCNALKYPETWLIWIIYNIIQLIKNTIQINIANVVKYIFYLFNAGITLVDWKVNGDVLKTQ
jgi:nicotinamide mononucleotide transporter